MLFKVTSCKVMICLEGQGISTLTLWFEEDTFLLKDTVNDTIASQKL